MLEIGQDLAAVIGQGEWELDAEPVELEDAQAQHEVKSPESRSPPPVPSTTLGLPRATEAPVAPESPPSPYQIVEAMLFIGGLPLTAAKACSAIRGLTPEQFRELIEQIGKKYRLQNRPYTVQPHGEGFLLTVKPRYRVLREKLQGGPRETRLSQSALDVLSLIAYRQPISRSEVDALRGSDSNAVIRQLLRVGLIAVAQRGDAPRSGQAYSTTPRFLEIFGLSSLDDLPRLEEA